MKIKIIVSICFLFFFVFLCLALNFIRKAFFISNLDILLDWRWYLKLIEYSVKDNFYNAFLLDRKSVRIKYNNIDYEICSKDNTCFEDKTSYSDKCYEWDLCNSKNRLNIKKTLNNKFIRDFWSLNWNLLFTWDWTWEFYLFTKYIVRYPYNYIYRPSWRNFSWLKIYTDKWNNKFFMLNWEPIQVVNKYRLIDPKPWYYKNKNFESN